MEFMNEHCKRSLDMDYVFNMLSPKTPYGIQKKREMKPYVKGEELSVEKDFEETQNFIVQRENYPKQWESLSRILNEVKEIRESLRRASEGQVLDEVELFEIKNFLVNIKDLLAVEETMDCFSKDILLYRCLELEELLDPEKQNMRTFYIYDAYSKNLSSIRQYKRELQRAFDSERKRITSLVEEALDVKLKLSGEVSILCKDEDKLVKARGCAYLTEGASTMLQVIFKLNQGEAQRKLQGDIENVKHEENSEEYRIKAWLSLKISEKVRIMYELTDKLGTLDFFMARAEFAIYIGGIRPILHSDDKIVIKNGRHIKLEKNLSIRDIKFSPISFEASRGVTIITGANMGGKTVNLKLAGMLTAMAQYGLFVPAEKFTLSLFDYIYFSIGDMQSIDSGLSTFGSEISGMIEILKYSDSKGLVLIDELARGTNPEEGYALSRAIVKYLKNTDAITLFTTHFDGITSEEGIKHLRVKGLKMLDFDKLNSELIGNANGIEAVLKYMDYTLEEVDNNYEVPKDAINIARLMGLDERILHSAEKIMYEGKGDNNGKAKS